jgi:hypothetical protein
VPAEYKAPNGFQDRQRVVVICGLCEATYNV